MVRLTVRPLAQNDIQGIIDYYDEINPEISENFLNDLESTISNIKSLPKGYQRRIGDVRISFLKRFPFGVFYKIYPISITVIAILHTSQDSSKWLVGR